MFNKEFYHKMIDEITDEELTKDELKASIIMDKADDYLNDNLIYVTNDSEVADVIFENNPNAQLLYTGDNDHYSTEVNSNILGNLISDDNCEKEIKKKYFCFGIAVTLITIGSIKLYSFINDKLNKKKINHKNKKESNEED